MFHSSSIHNFDTMFVILCVIAGATTHDISNSSKSTPVYKPHNRYKASFIELLLDSGVMEEIRTLRQPTNEINDQPFWRQSYRAGVHELLRNRKESFTICARLSNILNGSQMRLCQKHYEILATILPQVMHLTRRECVRITGDLRWNCSALDMFLDRSNSLSFTKEAALIRSLINASMMYLTVKTCFDNQFSTCGCYVNDNLSDTPASASPDKDSTHSLESGPLSIERHSAMPTNNVALSELDLRTLETGSPLRFTRSMIRRQACTINIPFADAFTRVFIDADDTRSLNKAHKILNEDSDTNHSAHRGLYEKRFADTDHRDLSFIKWTKSAVNLHNNNIGRQAVRDATSRQCRCHGVSGMCQYQTCWDRLNDIETVSAKLREIYTSHSDLARPLNLGTFSDPDLYLVKSDTEQAAYSGINTGKESSTRIRSKDLAYLYQSPDYCDAQPSRGYLGTVGRECRSISTRANSFSTPRSKITRANYHHHILGTCEYLCCDRGFYSELILDFIECNCSFKFCCKIQCDRCLRQRVRHFCR